MNFLTLANLTEAVPTALPVASLGGLNDDALCAVSRQVEALGRLIDALRVATAGEIAARSRTEVGPAGLAARKGCRSANELLQRLTQVSSATGAARLGLAALTRPDTALSGAATPAKFDHVRAALEAGELGVDAAIALTKNLAPLQNGVHPDALDAAERELVAAATGSSPDSSVPASADEIRIQASVWRATLDPDGLEPDEAHTMAKRSFRFGPERNGLVPVSGGLLPEAAGRVKRLFDAYLTPTTAPAFLKDEELADKNAVKDPRTKDQQRHDILIGVLDAMARSGNTPTVGGAAPTVLVTVRAEDLDTGGAGYADGVESPLSPTTVQQMVCSGGTQKVLIGRNGRILRLASAERCFTAPQRRAITARDGGCLIPGCSIPAGWCEVHHVIPAAEGGPTHPDNGVLLCWFHHRTIDTSGWAIRMRAGAPEVQAPPWLDHTRRWRPATKSRTALATSVSHHGP
ncbi:HNH endonuclease signature motif containing protein [Planctomonas deserti]|uniref:HNH endonuclease signature motif containing protein n=1 Tax=Planctomonas deserti TaxID=2144185 RepID=UPI000D3B0189|nr:HNH endonuclease signature motif containing protein [Planctomonas deserti]